MATNLQVIYDVRELLKKYTEDDDYDDRYLMYLYNLKRAKFLRQLYDDKTKNFDKILIQDLCLSFTEVDKGICGITADCTVMKSTKPLPQLLQVKNRNTLISVTPSIVFTTPFKIIEYNQAPHILDRPYSNSIYATIDADNHVLLISKQLEHKLITCLYFTGIFEDPEELKDYTNCCDCATIPESCFTEDTQYPAPAFLIDLIRDEIIKLLVTVKEQTNEDKNNNSDDQ